MRAGFIGLGNLGRAMVSRLQDHGVSLTVWNRTAERAADLDLALADSPAALISLEPAVLLCLADSDAVEVVLRGKDGLLAGDCAGKLIIDTTTNHPAPVRLFHELCRQKRALRGGAGGRQRGAGTRRASCWSWSAASRADINAARTLPRPARRRRSTSWAPPAWPRA